jgi:hypothetical protein
MKSGVHTSFPVGNKNEALAPDGRGSQSFASAKTGTFKRNAFGTERSDILPLLFMLSYKALISLSLLASETNPSSIFHIVKDVLPLRSTLPASSTGSPLATSSA